MKATCALRPHRNLLHHRAPDQTGGIEDIVVVARRTEERLQTVPISVTAMTGDQVREANITTGLDLQRLVPTLNVQQGSTGPGMGYSLRGVRTGVLTYFNDVPVSSSAVDLQLFDLSSIQALSGPQGTLFGRNSTGGAILFVPQRPTDEMEAIGTVRIGNYAERQVTLVSNLAISDAVKLRVSGQLTRRDGVVENELGPDFQSQHRDSMRASLLLDPTDWLSNYTVFTYSKRDETPYANILTLLVNRPCPPGPLSCLYGAALAQEAALQAQNGIRHIRHPYPVFQRDEQLGITNVIEVNLAGMTAKHIFGYRESNTHQAKSSLSIPLPIVLGENLSPFANSTTHEFQLLGSLEDGLLSWVAGAYLSRGENSGGAFRLIFGAPNVPYSRAISAESGGVTDQDSDAVYGQATLKLGGVGVTGGLRYTADRQRLVQSSRNPGGACNLPALPDVDLASCTRTLAAKFDAVTYNVSVDYTPVDRVLLYATTRKGYNTGGFNSSIPDPALVAYQPEHITDYEVGVKADWSIGGVPVRTNLAGFYAKYTDIIRSTNLVRNGVNYVGNFNAAEATIKGVQAELQIRPFPGLNLSGSYGYLSTIYDSFDNPLIGNATGNRFAQAPEHTFHLNGSYRQDLNGSGSLVANANYSYQSEVTFVDANLNSPNAFQKGYGLVDLRLDWNDVGGEPFDIGLFVKNATDKVYAVDIVDQSNTFGFVGAVFGYPRSYGVELRVRFGG